MAGWPVLEIQFSKIALVVNWVIALAAGGRG